MLSDIETVVLGKVVDDKTVKAARKSVQTGDHRVDFTVRVHGAVKVREDYERAATTSVPWKEVTTLLREGFRVTVEKMISKMDRGEAVTRDDLVEIVENGPLALGFAVDCVRECLERGVSGVGSVRGAVEIEEAVKGLLAETSGRLPPQQIPGAVVLDVSVDEVVAATPSEVAEEVQRTPQVA